MGGEIGKEKQMGRKIAIWPVILIFCTVALLAFSLGGRAAGPDPKKVSAVLKAGGGAVGGVGFMVLTGLSKVVRDSYPKLELTVVPGGWVGNLFRVNTGELDIGSTTIAMCALAQRKKAPFNKPLPKVKALYSTQDKLYYFAIFRKDAPINSIGELFEKKPAVSMCILQKGTTVELMWRTILESQGVTWDDLPKWGAKINFVAWGDAVNLVKDGHADGILSVGTKQIGWASDLTNSRDMKILTWENRFLKMMSKNFGFGEGSIPANTYKGISKAVLCPTDSGEIIVNANVPDTPVEAILTALADHPEKYAQTHKALAQFTAKGMAKNLKLPLHPAALKFYKSRNIPLPME